MDYTGYDPRAGRIMPPLPVATISTGVSLTERFKHYQQSHVERRQVGIGAGYGLPPPQQQQNPMYGQQPNPMYGQRRPYNNSIPSLIPNPAVSARNRQLALALAKRAMNPPVQNLQKRRLSVQSRLGIPITRQRGLAAGIPNRLGARRGVTRNSIPGRGQGLKQIQRSPGNLINRLGNRVKSRGGGRNQTLGQVQRNGGQRGRIARGGNARNRGGRGGRGGKPATNKEVKPSRELLDTELDSYMSHSKAYLDKELDDYMEKAKEALAQASAGIVTDDVTMAEVEPTS